MPGTGNVSCPAEEGGGTGWALIFLCLLYFLNSDLHLQDKSEVIFHKRALRIECVVLLFGGIFCLCTLFMLLLWIYHLERTI